MIEPIQFPDHRHFPNGDAPPDWIAYGDKHYGPPPDDDDDDDDDHDCIPGLPCIWHLRTVSDDG